MANDGALNFPSIPATATTMHKSQGSTFNSSVFVDMGSRKVLGSAFVALSRVKKFEDFF